MQGTRRRRGARAWRVRPTTVVPQGHPTTLNPSVRVPTSRSCRRTAAAAAPRSRRSCSAITSSCASRRAPTSWPAATPRTSSRRAWSGSTRRCATTATTARRRSAASPSSASRGRSSRPSRRRRGRSTCRSTGTCPSASRRATLPTTATARSATCCPGPSTHDPVNQVISSEEVDSLTDCLTRMLSDLEGRVLRLYLQGLSYERIANELGCDCKTVDNALAAHQAQGRPAPREPQGAWAELSAAQTG